MRVLWLLPLKEPLGLESEEEFTHWHKKELLWLLNCPKFSLLHVQKQSIPNTSSTINSQICPASSPTCFSTGPAYGLDKSLTNTANGWIYNVLLAACSLLCWRPVKPGMCRESEIRKFLVLSLSLYRGRSQSTGSRWHQTWRVQPGPQRHRHLVNGTGLLLCLQRWRVCRYNGEDIGLHRGLPW